MREKLEQYLSILLEVNAHTNLTAVREPKEIRVRHFEDSIKLLGAAEFFGKTVLDVGSGAGFPGLVIKIAEPACNVTLLDATEKKVRFLQRVCDELGLKGVTCLHGRAEVLAHDPKYREKFDIVTARGVAALPALCEICLPFVKVGGYFLSLKEKPEKFPGTDKLGGVQESDYLYTLSDGREHTICRFRKEKPAAEKYPRAWGKIKG
jgi:16S rRNA (guanine527-N7)-methyltransferase